jgi:plasmid stability protein
MSPDLRAKVEERAQANGRSLNAEIVAILQNGVDRQGPPDLDAFADQIAEKVAARLKGK